LQQLQRRQDALAIAPGQPVVYIANHEPTSFQPIRH
jgi:hypothetical protein